MNRIKVAVCSGGGANGFWEWCFLNFLRLHGITFEMICGTSTGTLVAYLYSKGLYALGDMLFEKTYHSNASNIFAPGICKLKNGKLVFNFKSIFQIGRQFKAPYLLDNKPLYDLLLSIEKEHPEYKIPFFWNTVSMQTGKVIRSTVSDFDTPEDRIKSIVASTAIPGVFPLQDMIKSIFGFQRHVGDGGMRDGLPINQMVDMMDPEKDYEMTVLSINKVEMASTDSLAGFFQRIGRALFIMFNEILDGDLERTRDRNKVARLYGEKPGYKNIPLKHVEYDGSRGVFEFTPEAYEDHIAVAGKGVLSYMETPAT